MPPVKDRGLQAQLVLANIVPSNSSASRH